MARGWAEGLFTKLSAGTAARPQLLTLQDVWERYVTAEFPHLRTRTKALYTENFRLWATTWGWEFIAERTTLEMADDFRKAMTEQGYAINTMRQVIYTVNRVLSWADGRELIARNRLSRYRFKVKKEDRPVPPPEHRGAEFGQILAQLDPALASQWRSWVALTICGVQGARQNAVLHLQPSDVTLGYHEAVAGQPGALRWVPGRIRWRPEWDKLGKDWTQPLRLAAQVAIEIALEWALRTGYAGAWLLPAGSSKSKRETYSEQSLWWMLYRAELAAGIVPKKGRGAHGLRRMLAGDVADVTGNMMLGLQAIGDSDMRMAGRYLQRRDDQLTAAFAKLDRPAEVSNPERNRNRDENATGAQEERPSQVEALQEVTDEAV